jgi:hypothetical protein
MIYLAERTVEDRCGNAVDEVHDAHDAMRRREDPSVVGDHDRRAAVLDRELFRKPDHHDAFTREPRGGAQDGRVAQP